MARLSIRAALGLGKETDLAPQARELPLEVNKQGSKARAIVLLALGGAVQYGAGYALFTPQPHVPWYMWALAAACFGAGFGLELLGVREMVRFERWHFTRESVMGQWRRLLARGQWEEPLFSYKGVLSTQELHGRWDKRPPYTLYTLTLQHALRSDRAIRLYASRSPQGFHAKHKHYARLFGLPALILTAVGVETRRPEDLGKSVQQRVAEGTLRTTFDPSAVPPGGRLTVRAEGSQLFMLARGSLSPANKVAAIVMVCGGAGMSVLGLSWGAPPRDWSLVFVILLWLFSAVGVLALFEDVLWEDVLIVSPHEIRAWRQFMRVYLRQMRIPTDEVEEVLIQALPDTEGVTTVQAITDKAMVHFGRGLSLAEKQWFRDCIIAVISR